MAEPRNRGGGGGGGGGAVGACVWVVTATIRQNVNTPPPVCSIRRHGILRRRNWLRDGRPLNLR